MAELFRYEIEDRDPEKREEGWNRNRETLRALGLWEVFSRMFGMEYLLDANYPEPLVLLAPDVPKTDEVHSLLEECTAAVRLARFDAPRLGENYSSLDFLTTVHPHMHRLKRFTFPEDPTLTRHLDIILNEPNGLAAGETLIDAVKSIVLAIEDVLIQYSRVDRGLYSVELDYEWTDERKWFVNFIIHWRNPEVRNFNVDGRTRRAFRCGQPYVMFIKWNEVDAIQFGAPTNFKLKWTPIIGPRASDS